MRGSLRCVNVPFFFYQMQNNTALQKLIPWLHTPPDALWRSKYCGCHVPQARPVIDSQIESGKESVRHCPPVIKPLPGICEEGRTSYWQRAIIDTLSALFSRALSTSNHRPRRPSLLTFIYAFSYLFNSRLFNFSAATDSSIGDKKKKKEPAHSSSFNLEPRDPPSTPPLPRRTNTPMGRQIFAFWLAGAYVALVSNSARQRGWQCSNRSCADWNHTIK